MLSKMLLASFTGALLEARIEDGRLFSGTVKAVNNVTIQFHSGATLGGGEIGAETIMAVYFDNFLLWVYPKERNNERKMIFPWIIHRGKTVWINRKRISP